MVIQTWLFDSHFLRKEQLEFVISRKIIDSACCQIKTFKQKLKFLKTCICLSEFNTVLSS